MINVGYPDASGEGALGKFLLPKVLEFVRTRDLGVQPQNKVPSHFPELSQHISCERTESELGIVACETEGKANFCTSFPQMIPYNGMAMDVACFGHSCVGHQTLNPKP